MKIYLPDAYNELKIHEKKITHWIWYVFPTEKIGMNDRHKTYITHKSALSLLNDSYHNINSILDNLEIEKVNGILLDLGLSSFQLNSLNRGFSFNNSCLFFCRF